MTEQISSIAATTSDAEFTSIRAYTDADLPRVLGILKRDQELLDMLARYRMRRLCGLSPLLARWILKLVLNRRLTGVTTIFELQERITGYYFFHMLESSVTSLDITGLEHLPASGGALLVSNHRDIVLDPAFVDYALYTKRRTTARLATGDNLATIPFARELMRLNKSFWVKRNESSPRQLLANLKTLSRYIRLSILDDQELVWLAQREGRAKNGLDTTEEAVLKMLRLADNKMDWQQTLAQLRPIPTSIAYEYDPCDLAKATELVTRARTGAQQKDDTTSVTTSIMVPKGRVAIHFGEILSSAEITSSGELAQQLDLAIKGSYRLFASNYTALAMLVEEGAGTDSAMAESILQTSLADFVAASNWLTAVAADEEAGHTDQDFVARVNAVGDPLVRRVMLGMYANPCVSRWRVLNPVAGSAAVS